MKTQYLVLDTSTGSIDGFYQNKKDAIASYNRAISRGCDNLCVCAVTESTRSLQISDSCFWNANSKGFAGDSRNSPLNGSQQNAREGV